MYIASCSFGKDSIATILLALENNEPLDRVVFAEVMFDHERNISGEIPEHIQWIYGTAIPKLEAMGVKVDVVRAEKDYITLFHKITTDKSKPKYRGKVRGFPVGRGCWGNSNLKIKPIRDYYKSFKDCDIVQYVGIAIDEPERLERLKGNKVSLLAKYKYSESMALSKCLEYGLLSPLYTTSYSGDYYMKPTAYWFVNCEPTYGKSYQNDKEKKIIMKAKGSSKAGICSEERSMISPDYARNFIADFILGKPQKHTQLDLFSHE